jgi:membrane protein DedA with SNARE-associated domain/rhodanese-related sulfurtransferase
MNTLFEFLIQHGTMVVFAAVFAGQIGLPLPVVPWLLAAGALAVQGKMSLLALLGVTVVASLLADMIWFYLGRYYGSRVLGILCRFSLEPGSCVARTQNIFERHGMRGIVFAKFIPGLSMIARPLAGSSRVSAGTFAFFEGISAILYGGLFILLGALFSHQLIQIMDALASLGHKALLLILGLVVAWMGYEYYERHRLLNAFHIVRITVDELYRKQEAGENLIILDLRSDLELKQDPLIIRGARHMAVRDVRRRRDEFPDDKDIILYCSCPNEVTSARVALQLRRQGIARVRPLLGGIEAWRVRHLPMEVNPDAPTDV